MALPFTKIAIVLGLTATLMGCVSLAGSPSAHPRADKDQYSLVEKSARSHSGCTFDYRIYEPLNPISGASVMLGHGFLRDQDNLIGLGQAMANQGIRVVTLDFCNMRPWNGNHALNASDMRSLTQLLMIESVVYGGFSAGALAAVLAADDSTLAIFALDLVDQEALGATAITQMDTPLLGLHGPASSCNAYNNGENVFKAHAETTRYSSASVLIENASHCEFESPSNWLCELACADDDEQRRSKFDSDEDTRQLIIQRAIDTITPYLPAL